MSHTPGPWEYFDDQTFSTLGDKRIVGSNQISPAIVFGGISETDANVRLIAAAPDLLAALKDLVSALDICGDLFVTEHPFTMDAARDAIAKAEGQSS